jgi:hypothetical protein
MCARAKKIWPLVFASSKKNNKKKKTSQTNTKKPVNKTKNK